MGAPRVRPVFYRALHGDPAAFHAALTRALTDTARPIRGQAFADVSILRIRDDQRHFWSPVLHLSVDHRTPEAWQLRGRFSPSSPVWTGFLAVYLVLACLACAAVSWGCAQWILDQTPWALWGVVVAVVLAAFTAGAAFIGQGLGAEDMYRLRCFVDEVAEGAGGVPSEGGRVG